VTAEALIRSALVFRRSKGPESTHRIEVSMHRILSYRSLLLASAIALAPLVVNAQATAAATCKDGTTSTATGRGACSGHGGVDKSAKSRKSATKAAKADTKVAKADTKAAKADTKVAKADTKADVKAATKVNEPAKAPKVHEQAAAKAVTSDVKQSAKVANATAANTDATNATAKCKDGTYSHAATHRGACSRHGGVAEWLKS
jgi:hypothetical protein